MTALESLRLRLGADPSDALLCDLLRDAELFILGYTGRSELPPALVGLQTEYAAATYRRMGAEGQSEHREGEVLLRFDTEKAALMKRLAPYRLGRVGLESGAGV